MNPIIISKQPESCQNLQKYSWHFAGVTYEMLHQTDFVIFSLKNGCVFFKKIYVQVARYC